MTFPTGWINVPTSPNQFRQFIKDFEAAHGHLAPALQTAAHDPGIAAGFAMLVFKPGGSDSSFEEN